MALTEIKTSGIADDAVTTDKLANAINTERTANTAKVSTTINNNADNRVITGSGTANTLEGEANLTFSSNTLTVHEASLKGNQLLFGPSGTAYIDHSTTGQDIQFRTSVSSSQDTTGPTIKSNGNIGFATAKGLEFQNSVTVKEASSNLNIDIAAGNNNIDFKSGGTAFLKLRGTNGNVEVVNGNVEIGTAGKGIHFHNYGTGTGIDSNLLDDYEEGSFNVTMVGQYGGSAQYSYRAGYYTKIGRVVHVVGDVRFNGSWSGSSGNVYIQLPFTSFTSGGTVGNGSISEWNLDSSTYDYLGITVDNNSANARITTHDGSNNNTGHLPTGQLGNNRYLKFGFTYITS